MNTLRPLRMGAFPSGMQICQQNNSSSRHSVGARRLRGFLSLVCYARKARVCP